MNQTPSTHLPLKNSLSPYGALALVTAVFMAGLSALSLFLPDLVYPDPDLAENFLTNDLVNIILGLPLFIYALITLNRMKLSGLLMLPGFLIFVIYNYIAYVLGRPLNWISIPNIGLVILSSYTLVGLLRAIDHQAVMKKIERHVGNKFPGWILVAFGLAFIGLAVSQIIIGIQEGTIPPLGEQAVSIADIVVSMGWVAGGILLLRQKALGYTTGLGLLVAASFLFIGLILYFFLAPMLVGRLFDWAEVITVLMMGLICFIPTGMFWRGVIKSEV